MPTSPDIEDDASRTSVSSATLECFTTLPTFHVNMRFLYWYITVSEATGVTLQVHCITFLHSSYLLSNLSKPKGMQTFNIFVDSLAALLPSLSRELVRCNTSKKRFN